MRQLPIHARIRAVDASQWVDDQPVRQHDESGYQQAIGVDLAFTAGSGDYTSIVPVAALSDRYYVRLVRRVRRDVLDIRTELQAVSASFPGCPLVSYVSDQERKAILPLLAANDGPLVNGIPARVDKLVRAQRTAELWNSGRIIVPPGRPWTADFIREMRNFSGRDKEPDDQVDALVAAIDFLEALRSISDSDFGTLGTRRA